MLTFVFKNMIMKNISVIGAGTMGNGIAHVFALNNFKVNLIDISEERLEKAITTIEKNLDRQLKKGTINEKDKNNTLSNIKTYTSIKNNVEDSDLIIEAATESIDIKLNLFKQLDSICKEHCILATNTSSISITKIASVTQRKDKVIGMHFMNPVPLMKLVEVIRGYSTTDKTSNTIIELSKKIGKIPVEVNDYPGFVANRILMPMINEAIIALFEGVAGVEEIDTVMKLGMAHPMGPLQLADFIGLDVCLAILNVLYEEFANPKYAPCPLLKNMVAAGKLGVKSGEGFYNYSEGIKSAKVSEYFKK